MLMYDLREAWIFLPPLINTDSYTSRAAIRSSHCIASRQYCHFKMGQFFTYKALHSRNAMH